MATIINGHYWIVGALYPILNLFLCFLYGYAALYTRFRGQFFTLLAGNILSLFINGMFFFIKIDKAFDFQILTGQSVQFIWIFQAAAEYLTIGMFAGSSTNQMGRG